MLIPPTTAPKVGARHFAVRTDGPDRPTKHKRRRNGMGFQRPSDRRPAGRGEGPSHPGVGVAATGAPVHLAGAPGDSMDEAPGRELFLGEKGMRAADTSSAVPRVVTPAFTADSLVLSAYGMGDGTGWGPGRCGSPSPSTRPPPLFWPRASQRRRHGFRTGRARRSRAVAVRGAKEGGVTNPPGDSLITPPSRSSLAVLRLPE